MGEESEGGWRNEENRKEVGVYIYGWKVGPEKIEGPQEKK